MKSLVLAKGWWAWVERPQKRQWMFLATPNYYLSFSSWKVQAGKF